MTKESFITGYGEKHFFSIQRGIPKASKDRNRSLCKPYISVPPSLEKVVVDFWSQKEAKMEWRGE
jgi:hypothetical protein